MDTPVLKSKLPSLDLSLLDLFEQEILGFLVPGMVEGECASSESVCYLGITHHMLLTLWELAEPKES